MMDIQFSRLRSVFAVRTDATMKTQFLRFQQRRLLLAVQDILLELSSQSYSLSFSNLKASSYYFCAFNFQSPFCKYFSFVNTFLALAIPNFKRNILFQRKKL